MRSSSSMPSTPSSSSTPSSCCSSCCSSSSSCRAHGAEHGKEGRGDQRQCPQRKQAKRGGGGGEVAAAASAHLLALRELRPYVVSKLIVQIARVRHGCRLRRLLAASEGAAADGLLPPLPVMGRWDGLGVRVQVRVSIHAVLGVAGCGGSPPGGCGCVDASSAAAWGRWRGDGGPGGVTTPSAAQLSRCAASCCCWGGAGGWWRAHEGRLADHRVQWVWAVRRLCAMGVRRPCNSAPARCDNAALLAAPTRPDRGMAAPDHSLAACPEV